MGSADDIEYRNSVRNMSVVLAAIAVTIFAAIFIPPYFSPTHDIFQSSVSAGTPSGFTMHLTMNATRVGAEGGVLVEGWINSTSDSLYNITAANAWALPENLLWENPCTSGWPIGIGVMEGHYTTDNYTLGTLVPAPGPLASCPAQGISPSYFVFEKHSSRALVDFGGTPSIWTIQTSFTFRQHLSGYGLRQGVYTAVLADEWGDVLTANFLVA